MSTRSAPGFARHPQKRAADPADGRACLIAATSGGEELVLHGRSARLHALAEAGLALTSELSLEGLLQRLIEAAAQLTDARYAALGVIDESGLRLERFVTHTRQLAAS